MSNQYNYSGYGGGGPPQGPGGGAPYGGGPHRGPGFHNERDARRPGPYDDRDRGGYGGGGGGGGPPQGGMGRDSGWGAGGNRGGPPPQGGRRRSASPDYSRGGNGGGGGPPGRGYDDRGYGPPRGGGPGGPGGYNGGGPPCGPPGGGGPGGGGPGFGDRGTPLGRQDLGDPFRRQGPAPGERDESEVIRQRVNRERPCRTLFVRNLKFGLMPEDVRRPFAEIGDIKTFFDLVEKRAMAFVTYYDSRAAMMAKDRMHNFPLMGRPMDVHYSLPRDADLAQACDREKGQGTLSIAVRNGPPGPAVAPSDQEIHQRFAPFGDIKLVFPDARRPELKYIEFFDSRGAVKAFDHLNGTPMAGGTLDLHFEWDKPAPAPPPQAVAPPPAPNGGFGYQQPAVSAFGAPGPVAAPPHGASPYPGAPGASPYPGAASASPYGAAAPPPAPLAAPGAAAHGVEQAKKMQDLLASLVANQGLLSGLPSQAQQPQQGYGARSAPAPAPAYASYAPVLPPPAIPAGASPLPPPVGSPLGAALPPAVTSLLVQAGAGAGGPPPPAGAAGGYSPMPAGQQQQRQQNGQGHGQGSTPAQVQALLALLAQQK